MIKQSILTVLLACTTIIGFSQQPKTIDSLHQKLKQAKNTQRVTLLLELSNAYYPSAQNKSLHYAFEALEQATKIDDQNNISLSYNTIGTLYHKLSMYDSAKVFYNKATKTSIDVEKTVTIYDNLGTLYKDISVFDSALQYHNQSVKLKQTLGDQQGAAVSYNNIGNVYLQMKKYDSALEYYEQALEIRKIGNEKQATAALLNNIGNVYKNLSQYNKAQQYFNEALLIQKEIGDKASIAYTLNSLGNFYFQLKIYDKAQEYYTKALDIRNELGNKNDIAASRFNIATVHRDIGNYKEALKHYAVALELRRETGAKEAEALTLNAIAGLYKNKKLYGLAIQNYQEALAMNQAMGNKVHIATSYERLGIVYKDTCLYDKAEEYYMKAIDYFSQTHDKIGIARIHNYLGNIYREKGDFAKALSFYKQSLQLYHEQKNISGMAYTANNIGELYANHKKTGEAVTYYLQAQELAKQASDKHLALSTSMSLYTLYKNQKNFEKSLSYYEMYTAIKDSIAHDKNIERISELEFEANIKLLEQQNENQELKLKEEKNKQTQFKLYLIISISILLGILGFSILLFRQFSQKNIAYDIISEKSKELELAYEKLEHINTVLHEKNEKIVDSLTYAKRIQKAILPSEESIQKVFPKSFIFYLPKEIVSGDFYWFTEQQDYAFFAVVDCTGHGIPGAFMSMVGNTLLNQIVNELQMLEPSQILNTLDTQVINTLRQYDETTKQEDGMEISLLRYHKTTKELIFAGAGHKIVVCKQGNTQIYASSQFSIGGMHSIKQDKHVSFNQIQIDIEPGSTLYMFSDGFYDQFGGEYDERFSSGRLQKLLSSFQSFDINEQYIQLSKTFDDWKGNTSQLDDVLVVGIEF